MAGARPYDVVTFDCYGTLVDWEGGLATAIMRAAWADGVRLERGAIIRAYMAAEREVEAGGYRSYQEVLAESARGVAARLGWRLDPARASFLPRACRAGSRSPTPTPLERLHAAGYALGILSNIDDDLLTATRRHFTDLRAHRHRAAGARLQARAPALRGRPPRGRRRAWLHVGQGYFHDMVPARTQGIPNAWINRNGDTPDDGGGPTGSFPRCGSWPTGWPPHGDFRRDADLRPASPRAGARTGGAPRDDRHPRAAPRHRLSGPTRRRSGGPRRSGAMAQAVELILMRQLASYSRCRCSSSTRRTLLYYNEPAERLLGRRYDETGEMPATEWGTMFTPTAEDGSPFRPTSWRSRSRCGSGTPRTEGSSSRVSTA